jgi:hypothetical protein
MTANYNRLSEILVGIGIDSEMRDAVVEFADWTYGDTDIVLVNKNKVKSVLIDFVSSGMIEEWDDTNTLALDEDELKYNIKDTFSSIPNGYYVDITG